MESPHNNTPTSTGKKRTHDEEQKSDTSMEDLCRKKFKPIAPKPVIRKDEHQAVLTTTHPVKNVVAKETSPLVLGPPKVDSSGLFVGTSLPFMCGGPMIMPIPVPVVPSKDGLVPLQVPVPVPVMVPVVVGVNQSQSSSALSFPLKVLSNTKSHAAFAKEGGSSVNVKSLGVDIRELSKTDKSGSSADKKGAKGGKPKPCRYKYSMIKNGTLLQEILRNAGADVVANSIIDVTNAQKLISPKSSNTLIVNASQSRKVVKPVSDSDKADSDCATLQGKSADSVTKTSAVQSNTSHINALSKLTDGQTPTATLDKQNKTDKSVMCTGKSTANVMSTVQSIAASRLSGVSSSVGIVSVSNTSLPQPSQTASHARVSHFPPRTAIASAIDSGSIRPAYTSSLASVPSTCAHQSQINSSLTSVTDHRLKGSTQPDTNMYVSNCTSTVNQQPNNSNFINHNRSQPSQTRPHTNLSVSATGSFPLCTPSVGIGDSHSRSTTNPALSSNPAIPNMVAVTHAITSPSSGGISASSGSGNQWHGNRGNHDRLMLSGHDSINVRGIVDSHRNGLKTFQLPSPRILNNEQRSVDNVSLYAADELHSFSMEMDHPADDLLSGSDNSSLNISNLSGNISNSSVLLESPSRRAVTCIVTPIPRSVPLTSCTSTVATIVPQNTETSGSGTHENSVSHRTATTQSHALPSIRVSQSVCMPVTKTTTQISVSTSVVSSQPAQVVCSQNPRSLNMPIVSTLSQPNLHTPNQESNRNVRHQPLLYSRTESLRSTGMAFNRFPSSTNAISSTAMNTSTSITPRYMPAQNQPGQSSVVSSSNSYVQSLNTSMTGQRTQLPCVPTNSQTNFRSTSATVNANAGPSAVHFPGNSSSVGVEQSAASRKQDFLSDNARPFLPPGSMPCGQLQSGSHQVSQIASTHMTYPSPMSTMCVASSGTTSSHIVSSQAQQNDQMPAASMPGVPNHGNLTQVANPRNMPSTVYHNGSHNLSSAGPLPLSSMGGQNPINSSTTVTTSSFSRLPNNLWQSHWPTNQHFPPLQENQLGSPAVGNNMGRQGVTNGNSIIPSTNRTGRAVSSGADVNTRSALAVSSQSVQSVPLQSNILTSSRHSMGDVLHQSSRTANFVNQRMNRVENSSGTGNNGVIDGINTRPPLSTFPDSNQRLTSHTQTSSASHSVPTTDAAPRMPYPLVPPIMFGNSASVRSLPLGGMHSVPLPGSFTNHSIPSHSLQPHQIPSPSPAPHHHPIGHVSHERHGHHMYLSSHYSTLHRPLYMAPSPAPNPDLALLSPHSYGQIHVHDSVLYSPRFSSPIHTLPTTMSDTYHPSPMHRSYSSSEHLDTCCNSHFTHPSPHLEGTAPNNPLLMPQLGQGPPHFSQQASSHSVQTPPSMTSFQHSSILANRAQNTLFQRNLERLLAHSARRAAVVSSHSVASSISSLRLSCHNPHGTLGTYSTVPSHRPNTNLSFSTAPMIALSQSLSCNTNESSSHLSQSATSSHSTTSSLTRNVPPLPTVSTSAIVATTTTAVTSRAFVGNMSDKYLPLEVVAPEAVNSQATPASEGSSASASQVASDQVVKCGDTVLQCSRQVLRESGRTVLCCWYCDYHTAEPRKMLRHQKKEDESMKCQLCSFHGKSRCAINQHYKEVHLDKDDPFRSVVH